MKGACFLPAFADFFAYCGITTLISISSKLYRQVIKDFVLARCLSKVPDKNGQFSADAALSASAFLEWVPFDAGNGPDKIDGLINKCKDHINGFHSERKSDVQGVTLNCLRLYHSSELENLVPQLITGNPDRSWIQDNPQ